MIHFPLEGLDLTDYVINKEGTVNLVETNKKLLYDLYAITNVETI